MVLASPDPPDSNSLDALKRGAPKAQLRQEDVPVDNREQVAVNSEDRWWEAQSAPNTGENVPAKASASPRAKQSKGHKRLGYLNETAMLGLGLCGLVAGYVVWRLSGGTLSVALAKPNVESAIERILGAPTQIGDLNLGWDSRQRGFVVTARRIQAKLPGRVSPLIIDQAQLSLNAGALAFGKVAISSAKLSGVKVVLVVDGQGASAISFGSDAEALAMPRAKASAVDIRQSLMSVRGLLVSDQKHDAIQSLSLSGAQLLVLDASTRQRLMVSNVQVQTLANDVGTIGLKASAQIPETGGSFQAAIAQAQDPTQKLAFASNFTALRISNIPNSILPPAIRRILVQNAGVSGNVLVRLTGKSGDPIDAAGQISVGAGRIGDVQLSAARARFDYRGDVKSLSLNDLSVLSDKIHIERGVGAFDGRNAQQRKLTLSANRLDFFVPQMGELVSANTAVQAVIGPDNAPIAGRGTSSSLSYSRSGITNFLGRDIELVLNKNQVRAGPLVALDLRAREISEFIEGRRVQARGVDLAVEANRTGGLSVRTAQGRAQSLNLALGNQSLDATNLRFSARDFPAAVDARLSIPRSASLESDQLNFALGQSGFAHTGQATALALSFENYGSGRANGNLSANALQVLATGSSGVSASSQNLRMDMSQSGPASARVNALQANRLSVQRGNSAFAGQAVSVLGTLNVNGLADGKLTAQSVELRNNEQLLRPFFAQNMQATGDFSRRGIDLNGFSFRHADVGLSGNTQITFSPSGKPAIDLQADVNGAFSVGTLLAAWPRRFLRDVRESIRRLVPEATAEVSRLSLAIPADVNPKQILPKSAIDLEFALRDVTVTYLDGMSPITDIAGTGQLRGDSLFIEIPRGRVGNVVLSEGVVDMPQFKPRGGVVNIGANIDGDVSDIAREIDMPGLALLTKANLNPARLSGSGSGQIELAIPLKPNLQPEEIEVTIGADFKNAGLTQVFAGLDATNGVATLTTIDRVLRVTGSADVAGNRFAFNWGNRTNADNRTVSSLSANGDVSIESLKQLGLDIAPYATGRAAVTIATSAQGPNFGEGLVRADFDNTIITLPGDLWKKEDGKSGTASARIYPREGGGWNLQDVRFDAQGAVLRGAVDLAESGRVVDLRFSKVMIENAGDLSVDVTPSEMGNIVTLRGSYLNLSPFLARKNVSEQALDVFNRPLVFSADIDKVATSADRALSDVHADIVRDLVGWRTLSAYGQSAAGLSRIDLNVERDGRRSVKGVISDAGFFAQLLYPGAPVQGGTGTIEGELPVVGANSTGSLAFTGKNIILARENAVPVVFQSVELPMSVRGGVVTLRDGQASGDAYTVKASGYVDLEAGRLDLRGVATPGGLNRVLADIPLFGAILGGGANEGLVGVTFAARGTLQAPRIQANPISALAPGFLRKLFEGEAPLSPQPIFTASAIIGEPVRAKWPYGPSEDMSETNQTKEINLPVGPVQ